MPVKRSVYLREIGFRKRLIAAYASLFVIGLGSVMFHATLRYEMQGREATLRFR